MKKYAGEIVVGVILVIVTVLGTYYFSRPSPLAFASCNPLQGEAPLSIRCENESNYHTNVVWDIGDQSLPKIKDRDTIEHIYVDAGTYTITLVAHGHGSPGTWSQDIKVKQSRALDSPIDITIIARTKENREIKTNSVAVSNTKDDHPSPFSEHSQFYTQTFTADPGYRIIAVDFMKTSAARASDIQNRISSDGSEAELAYQLTSGPAFDRYRGWIRGDVVLKQELLQPAQNVTLGEGVKIENYGVYSLSKSVALESIGHIQITDANGQIIASGDPNGLLISSQINLAFRVGEWLGEMFIQVEKQ